MKSTRESYGEYLVKKGFENKDVVVFDADLANATCTKLFKKEFPDRHFDMGISEQDMVGTACGMALTGKKCLRLVLQCFLQDVLMNKLEIQLHIQI